MEEIRPLRNASTPREKAAFYWFMETFIDCVVGKIQCRQTKYLQTISNSIITISDEAFALLLFENYVDKWHAQFNHQCTKTEMSAKLPRMHGKFTSKKVGQAEFVDGLEKECRPSIRTVDALWHNEAQKKVDKQRRNY